MGRVLLIFSLFGLILACNINKDKGKYRHGRLEYKITYLNAKEDNYDPSFLPKKMSLEFNQEYSINLIDGFMGLFKLGNITYLKNRKVKTHLKVLDKNYAFAGRKNEMMCCFDCLEGMRLEKDSVTRTIGGLISKKARVSFKNSDEKYDIFYTDEIDLARPNSTNPYHEINGVLTEFRLKMGPYLMQFTATKFDPDQIPEKEMAFPNDAIVVNRQEMVAILDRLMDQNI
jgi:ubiquitin